MDLNLIFGQELKNWQPKNLLPYDLVGFADSNFARDVKNRKLVMRYDFFLNRAVVF